MEGVVEGFEVGWREGKGLELDWLVWRVVGMGEGRTVIRVDQVVVVVVEVDGRDVLVVAAGCGHSVSTGEVCVMVGVVGRRSGCWVLNSKVHVNRNWKVKVHGFHKPRRPRTN